MKARISEILKSVQGEGKYVGVSQVFVRFCECNIQCAWCDTQYARGKIDNPAREFDVAQVMEKISCFEGGLHSVSLTGGEPLLQHEFLKELLARLKMFGRRTYLETNGTLHKELQEVIDKVDIIAMDFKLPSSAKCGPFWDEHYLFLKAASAKDVFVKAVITADTLIEDMRKSIQIIADINHDILLVLQPNTKESPGGVVLKCWEFQDYALRYLRDVRVIPQAHKMLGLP